MNLDAFFSTCLQKSWYTCLMHLCFPGDLKVHASGSNIVGKQTVACCSVIVGS